MIKLKVEWLHTCPDCGTQLVVDFACDAVGCRACPWCGCASTDGKALRDPDIRKHVRRAVTQFEDEVNGTIDNPTHTAPAP